MSRSTEQKIKLLVLYEILYKNTDEERTMNTGELIASLKERGIEVSRKTLYEDIEALNKYGYEVMCDISMRFTVNRVLLLKSGNKYVIAYYALIRDPKYKSELLNDGWCEIDMFWGFPAMIKSTGEKDDYYLENMLYMPEKVFDNITEAEQYFADMQKVDYQMFFEDVFGG